MSVDSTPASPSAVRWLHDHPDVASPYTRERILASPEFVDHTLETCAPMVFAQALDAGSGAGYHTFALANRFANVLAVDTDRRQVRSARAIARSAGVTNVQFMRADVERLKLGAAADCIWCNCMSHNVGSRIRLFAASTALLRPGGWLVYAEVAEGFAVKLIAKAIDERDAYQLRLRIRQIVAGLLGIPRFRFFVSGSAERELSRLGLTVIKREAEDWNGLVNVERVWARAEEPTPRVDSAGTGDYTTMDPELGSVRSCARAYMQMRKTDGIGPATKMLHIFNETEDNRFAPLLLVFELAEMLPFALSGEFSVRARLAARLDSRSVDWSRVGAVHGRLLANAREYHRMTTQ
jgi:SAM-dependent methyltransferase